MFLQRKKANSLVLASLFPIAWPFIRTRQRSGEGVVQGNSRPKGCFWRVFFFSAPLRFALQTLENLKWEEKKRTLQKTFLDDRFSARRLLRSFGAPPILEKGEGLVLGYTFFFSLECKNRALIKQICRNYFLGIVYFPHVFPGMLCSADS